MKSFYLSLLLLILNLTAFSQINPPNFYCLNANGTAATISWTPTTAPCGPIVGYEVFYSDQIGGPYQSFTINDGSILDTTFAQISDPMFCFMQSIINCAGQPVINSDTLIYTLAPPEVTSISVNNSNQIEVSWEASPSTDVSAYLVYLDGLINNPDTVYGLNSTTYLDINSDPSINSHSYTITWYRGCVAGAGGRRGTIGEPYNSILLENLQQDKCTRSFTFSWNGYENYSVGTLGYSIGVSVNSGAYTSIDTVPENQLIYLYENAINGNQYCFRVSAILPNNFIAHSNTVCDSAKVVDAPRGAHLRNASVIDANTIHVEYYPDSAGIIDDLNFQRGIIGTDYQTWAGTNISSSGTVPSYDTYEDVGSNPSSTDYYYRFRRVDECENEYFAEAVKTIHLETDMGPSVRAPFGYDLSAEISWTPFQITDGTVIEYHVIKYVNGDSMLLASVSGSINSTEDLDALNSSTLDTVCYQILADIDLEILDFVSTSTRSQSNIECLQPTPKIVSPSGFRPGSPIYMNATFKPIIFFGTEEAYTFRMYDRWNRSVFETTNPAIGWDGTIDGREAPIDVYVYYVSFLGQDGNTYSKSGTVALVR